MKAIFRLLACLLVSGTAQLTGAQPATPGPDMILIRASAKSPTDVVDAIKAYTEAKKWVYLGAYAIKPKQGDVTMVKVCIPQVGGLLWPLGLQLSALVPCGNFGVYLNKGKTEVSMLHPSYMQILYPHPEVEKAVGVAIPLLTEMLDAVVK
jgi:hypothetical protein